MADILYLLRRPLDEIDGALFGPDEIKQVILVESAGLQASPDQTPPVLLRKQDDGDHPLSYDDLVELIFASERTIVI